MITITDEKLSLISFYSLPICKSGGQEVEIPLFHEIEIFSKILHNCSGDQKGLRDPSQGVII
jgi:hypothetical protein